MTKQLDERKIIEALNKVATIDGNSDIVTAGAVSGVVIKEGHIGFTIEIDPKDKDKADQLRAAAEKAVLALNGVLSATAMLTASVWPQHASIWRANPARQWGWCRRIKTIRTAPACNACYCRGVW